MPVYILMTKLTSELTRRTDERERIGRDWKRRVDETCPEVKWIAHYSLLGPWDFMDIYEAPGEEVAAKVSLITRASGAFQAESWPAIPYARFLELVDELS